MFMQVLLSILAVLLFIGLILVHEWGHFIVARRNGVDVEEFGLGFPPRAWSKKLKSGLVLSLNWLPLGGFVKLKGEYDYDTRPYSFGAASLKTKTKIMLAGVTMNLLVGLVLLTALAWIGLPKIITRASIGQDQFTVASDTKIVKNEVLVSYVLANSPAAKAGLEVGDQVLQVGYMGALCTGSVDSSNDGICSDSYDTVTNSAKLKSLTSNYAGTTVPISIKRGGKDLNLSAHLLTKQQVQASQNSSDPKGYLGIVPQDYQIRRSTWSAPIVALGFTKQLVFLTFQGLGHALAGLGSTIAGLVTHNHTAREAGQTQASGQVGGPVAIADILWHSGSLGFNYMLMIIAIISLTLALMNVLPIPALDGGRLFMALLSRLILHRPLSHRAEERIIGTSYLVIIVLIILITVVDVQRFF